MEEKNKYNNYELKEYALTFGQYVDFKESVVYWEHFEKIIDDIFPKSKIEERNKKIDQILGI